MKVSELIALLERCNPDAEVRHDGGGDHYCAAAVEDVMIDAAGDVVELGTAEAYRRPWRTVRGPQWYDKDHTSLGSTFQ